MSRQLTTQEFIVLGLLGLEPQSGYGILSFFGESIIGGSASPGTIYPILKRLEAQNAIAGTLEAEYETRPRKVYRLTETGETLLDSWLREVPQLIPFYQERETAMWKFQFMEGRLPTSEILTWLNNYLDGVRIFEAGRRFVQDRIAEEMQQAGQTSLHRRLVMEVTLMELNTLRKWLQSARDRIASQNSD